MKKILIVNDGFPPHSWGGANTVSFLHAKGLKGRGYEVRVFATTQDKNAQTGAGVYEGIPVHTFYTDYHPRWWAYKSLHNGEVVEAFEKELRAFAPDIVHFHNIHHYFSYRCIQISKTCLPAGRVFLTAHDVMSFAYRKLRPGPYRVSWLQNLRDARLRFNPFRNFVIKKYLRQLNQMFAVSGALAAALADNGIAGNVSVVHNGVDMEMFPPCAREERLTVLFVGRFTPDKGRDVTLRAFANVVQKIPEAQLLVVGFPTGQKEPAMDALIDELGIRKNVILHPPVPYPQMPQWYCRASVVVVPSIIFDSFPTANLEAMARGLPVIATCFGGSREIIEDGATGYIVDPLDVENLTQKMHLLLVDAPKAKSMGEQGRARVRTNFSLEVQMASYEKFY